MNSHNGSIKIYFLILLNLIINPPIKDAVAQSQCPPGYMRIATGEGPASPCAPDPSYANPPAPIAPAQPRYQWEDRWGAIATKDGSVYGVSENMESKRSANKSAIKDCKRRGGGKCKVIVSYFNQCAAIAAGEKSAAYANAPDEKEATHTAKNTCLERNKDCRIYYSACASPVQVLKY